VRFLLKARKPAALTKFTHHTPRARHRSASATNGRPKPWMSTRVAEALDAYPLFACVKVDDTLPGIAEGLNAGMWAVGVARSGNEMGLDEQEDAALLAAQPAAHAARLAAARERMRAAGAHYVVDSVKDLLPVLDEINARLAKGETPPLS
jgi:beta-phosphoglucomutase-like phosphatase (HAD superfamily)